jgi:hypothetical protein
MHPMAQPASLRSADRPTGDCVAVGPAGFGRKSNTRGAWWSVVVAVPDGMAASAHIGYKMLMEKPKYVTVRARHGMQDQPFDVDASTRCVRVPQDYEIEYVIERRGDDGLWNEQRPVLVIDDVGTLFSPSVPFVELEACAPGELVYTLICNDPPGERTRLWRKWEVVNAAAMRS